MVADADQPRRDGRHEDQAPAGLAVSIRVLTDEELRAEIEPEDEIEALLRDLVHAVERLHAGIRTDDVDFPKVGDGVVEEARDLRHAGDVGLDGVGAGAGGLDLRADGEGAGVAFDVVYDDGGAAGAELEGDAGADAAGGACYEGDFAGEGGEGAGGGGGVAVGGWGCGGAVCGVEGGGGGAVDGGVGFGGCFDAGRGVGCW